MKIISTNKLQYSEIGKELNYEFSDGHIYAIYARDHGSNDSINRIFDSLSYVSLTKGICFWKGIDVTKISPKTYRKNMISVIVSDDDAFANMSVQRFLKYATDNFSCIYSKTVEEIDTLKLISSVLYDFGFGNEKMKLKIKCLTCEEKLKLHLVLSVLRENELLLINRVLDGLSDDIDIYFEHLKYCVQKYHQCIVIFTKEENVALKADYIIDL